MIKILQKKFIKTAMIAITLLLVIFVGAINIVNVITVSGEIDKTLELLTENSMSTPPRMEQIEPEKEGLGKFFSPIPDEERAMSARYFTAEVDFAGQIIRINTENVFSVTDEEAEELIARIILSGNYEGKIEGFKFKTVQTQMNNTSTIVCVDTSASLRGAFTVVVISIGVGAVCWLMMLLFVSLLSKKAIKPIAENFEKQRQFVTDAGHEIKTPLAIILANTDALELHNGESKWSKNIRSQTIRLNGLMQNLLTLSRSDEAKEKLAKEEQCVDALLNEAVEGFVTLAENQQKKICAEIGENITVTAHRESLQQLFTVLIDNAVKYSSDCSEIYINLKQENGKTVFTTKNICDGLPECEPEKLFDRFYRADEARTQKNGGYGIGLSVAHSIAENHGWEISAQYEKDNIIVFTVIM